MYNYATACAEPTFDYFKIKFNNNLQLHIQGFKAAHLFDPVKILFKLKAEPSIFMCNRYEIPFLS